MSANVSPFSYFPFHSFDKKCASEPWQTLARVRRDLLTFDSGGDAGLAADTMRARVIVRAETDSRGRTTARSARLERLPRQDVCCWKKSISFSLPLSFYLPLFSLPPSFSLFFPPFISRLSCLITQTDGERRSQYQQETLWLYPQRGHDIGRQQRGETNRIHLRGDAAGCRSHGPKPCKWSLLFTWKHNRPNAIDVSRWKSSRRWGGFRPAGPALRSDTLENTTLLYVQVWRIRAKFRVFWVTMKEIFAFIPRLSSC